MLVGKHFLLALLIRTSVNLLKIARWSVGVLLIALGIRVAIGIVVMCFCLERVRD